MTIRKTIGAMALTAALAAPVLPLAAAAAEVSADTVLATVNGTDITLGHMIALRGNLPQEYLALPDDVLFKGLLDQLIQQTALAQEGEKKLTRRDELVLEIERRSYLAGVVLDETAAAAASDEALKSAYDAKYATAAPGKEYNASHILVPTEDEAKAVKAQIDGGADFTEVAKSKSTGPSGENGGDLGWFGPGMMVKPFEDAVVTMEPGQVSDPVQTEFGWHIIRLNEVREASAPAFDEVREELMSELQQRAVQERIASAGKDADVRRMDEGIDPAVLKDETLLGN